MRPISPVVELKRSDEDPAARLGRGGVTGPKYTANYTESSWALLAGLRFFLAFIVFAGHLSWFADLGAILTGVSSFGGRPAVLGFLLISGLSIGHSIVSRPEGYFRRR